MAKYLPASYQVLTCLFIQTTVLAPSSLVPNCILCLNFYISRHFRKKACWCCPECEEISRFTWWGSRPGTCGPPGILEHRPSAHPSPPQPSLSGPPAAVGCTLPPTAPACSQPTPLAASAPRSAQITPRGPGPTRLSAPAAPPDALPALAYTRATAELRSLRPASLVSSRPRRR